MKMKNLKWTLPCVAVLGLSAGLFTACTNYDDEISDLQSQIDQNSADISATKESLNAALNAGKLITNVKETATGWEITFSDSKTITLTNGKDGEAGKDGASSSSGSSTTVTTDGNYVTITIGGTAYTFAKGSEIKSLAILPTVIENGVPAIDAIVLYGGSGNQQAFAAPIKMSYRINPSAAYVTDTEWSFLDRGVTIRATGDKAGLLANATFTVANDEVNVVAKAQLPKADIGGATAELFALAAEYTDRADVDQKIVSDYAQLKATAATYGISDKTEPALPLYAALAAAPANITSAASLRKHSVQYDGSLDLNTLVVATTGGATFASKGITEESFKFSLPASFNGTDATNMNAMFAIDATGVLTVNNYAMSAVGRAALVQVDLMSDPTFGSFVAESAYFLVECTKTVVTPPAVGALSVTATTTNPTAAGLFVASTNELSLNWQDFNLKVLNGLGMTHAEFVSAGYSVDKVEEVIGGGRTTLTDGVDFGLTNNIANAATTSSVYSIDLNPTTKSGAHTWIISYKAAGKRDVEITHNFTIAPINEAMPALAARYVDATGVQTVKGRYNGSRHEMKVAIKEAFDLATYDYMTIYNKYSGNDLSGAAIAPKFDVVLVGSVTDATLEKPATLSTKFDNILQSDMALTAPMSAASKDYSVQLVYTYPNGDKQVQPWTIRFENPIEITTLAIPAVVTSDVTTYSDDIRDYVVVKFNNKVAYQNGAWDTAMQAKYGLTITIQGAVESDPSIAGLFKFSGYAFEWNNGGTTVLQSFKGGSATYSVEAKYSDGTVYVNSEKSSDVMIQDGPR